MASRLARTREGADLNRISPENPMGREVIMLCLLKEGSCVQEQLNSPLPDIPLPDDILRAATSAGPHHFLAGTVRSSATPL